MSSPEKTEKSKVMPCGSTEKSIEELEKEGWIQDYSFHSRIPEQWNMACDKVSQIVSIGDWEAVLRLDEEEGPRRDTVTYIYKRKTPKRLQWEKEKGYVK